MTRHARILPLLIGLALVVGACASEPDITQPPPPASSPSPSPTPVPTEAPFEAAAWPEGEPACGVPGYAGRLGRIEAVDARTVRFTLCGPDGAFLARVAHPAFGILDTTSLARIAEDRSAVRTVAGSGPYRIATWDEDDNVLLERVDTEPGPVSVSPTVILRWEPDAAARVVALQDASVDGIDAPGPTDLDAIATQPELVVTPRPGLATAFLAFGRGPAFASTAVRRAIAASLDRSALASGTFRAGSVMATHVSPCVVELACGGRAWYAYNAPAASAALDAASFDRRKRYRLRVPDQPVPGLPDPTATAEAVAAQLEANIGLRITVEVMPLDAFREAVAGGALDGLYLDGVASSLADATGFLEPLFAAGVRATPAVRTPAAAAALTALAREPDRDVRASVIEDANDAIRSAAALIPLAHTGAVASFRSDVTGAVVSPLGLDPLGAATPGDRPQLVFMQATEPAGAWCADETAPDAVRLCGLVSESLYGFAPGAMAPEPVLAEACSPDDDAVVWTCGLDAPRRFSDGMRVDARDVLASFVAQWDGNGPIRAASPEASFAAWDELFGEALEVGG